MSDKRLMLALLIGGGAFALYAKRQSDLGQPLFGGLLGGGGGSVAGAGDPRFKSGQVGIQGTGNTNPIAAAISGISGALAKLVTGTASGGRPATNAPATGGGTPGALNAGGTYTTGLPPGGDTTHDPFAGFDQFQVWNPTMDVWGDWYTPSTSYGEYGTGTMAAPGIPGQDVSFDGFVGLER